MVELATQPRLLSRRRIDLARSGHHHPPADPRPAIKQGDFAYSLGFTISKDRVLEDVVAGSPAYQTGIGPGMKLIAVNGRKWSPAVLHDALKASLHRGQNIDLLVENAQFFKTYAVAYHDGDRNPHLERITNQPDILDDILKPLTK